MCVCVSNKKRVVPCSYDFFSTLGYTFPSLGCSFRFVLLRGLLALALGAARTLGDAGLETVLEAAGDVLEVAHAASADGLSPLGLLAPVDCVSNVSDNGFLDGKETSSNRSSASAEDWLGRIHVHLRVLAEG